MTRAWAARDVLVVAFTTLGAFALLSATDGGYAEVVWYPVGVLLLILGVVVSWAAPPRRLGKRTGLASAFFAAYTAWAYLSIIWAGDRGLALTGANRTLVYLIVFLVVLSRRWGGRDAMWYAAAWAFSTAAIGLVSLAWDVYSAHPEDGFADGRLILPIDYANANAALFVLAALVMLVAAQARTMSILARSAALGAAGVSVELAVLAQSKGGALAVAATMAVFFAVILRRVRFAVPVAIVAAMVALVHRPLLVVYERVGTQDRAASAAQTALYVIGASFTILVVAGLVSVLVDRRLAEASPRRSRLLAGMFAAAVCAMIVVGASITIERYGDPASIVSRSWHAFKYPATTSTASSHFATTAGNHRYDFWRVATEQVKSSPVLGAGMDNFAVDYLRDRRSSEEPLYPHSLEARLLGGTGLVGFLLFGGWATISMWLATAAARSGTDFAGVGAAALAMLAYWIAHGSVDWLWEFPALTCPVVAVVACATVAEESLRPIVSSSKRRRLCVAALALASMASLVALVPAWLATNDTAVAVRVWRDDPATAYARVADAARLNRVSDQPYVIGGTIAERRRDWPKAERLFSRALQRNRSNWYSLLERGIANVMMGRADHATRDLEAARALDPREPIIRGVLGDVRARRRIETRSLDAAMLERAHLGR
jgi:hypothetical protein